MKFKLFPRHGLKHRVATTGISSLNPKTFTIFYFDDGRIAINGQYSKSACEQWLSYRPESVFYNATSYLDKWNRSNIRRELKKIDNMLNLACETCIYDRKKCKLSPIQEATGRLYCPGKRSKYESGFRHSDTCDICGEKFTNEDYLLQRDVVYEFRNQPVYERIETLRVFCFDTRENEKMLCDKVEKILIESEPKRKQ